MCVEESYGRHSPVRERKKGGRRALSVVSLPPSQRIRLSPFSFSCSWVDLRVCATTIMPFTPPYHSLLLHCGRGRPGELVPVVLPSFFPSAPRRPPNRGRQRTKPKTEKEKETDKRNKRYKKLPTQQVKASMTTFVICALDRGVQALPSFVPCYEYFSPFKKSVAIFFSCNSFFPRPRLPTENCYGDDEAGTAGRQRRRRRGHLPGVLRHKRPGTRLRSM